MQSREFGIHQNNYEMVWPCFTSCGFPSTTASKRLDQLNCHVPESRYMMHVVVVAVVV